MHARTRINHSLGIGHGCTRVPLALVAYVATEATKLADLVEVMSPYR